MVEYIASFLSISCTLAATSRTRRQRLQGCPGVASGSAGLAIRAGYGAAAADDAVGLRIFDVAKVSASGSAAAARHAPGRATLLAAGDWTAAFPICTRPGCRDTELARAVAGAVIRTVDTGRRDPRSSAGGRLHDHSVASSRYPKAPPLSSVRVTQGRTRPGVARR